MPQIAVSEFQEALTELRVGQRIGNLRTQLPNVVAPAGFDAATLHPVNILEDRAAIPCRLRNNLIATAQSQPTPSKAL